MKNLWVLTHVSVRSLIERGQFSKIQDTKEKVKIHSSAHYQKYTVDQQHVEHLFICSNTSLKKQSAEIAAQETCSKILHQYAYSD